MQADLFDQSFGWRVEASEALGLGRDELIPALSPGAAFPAVLESMVHAFPPKPDALVDLGAGAGGASEWLRLATGATVIAVEPEAGARRAAVACFPELQVVEGTAAATGLADSSADIVTLCGVWSLLTEVGPVLSEVDRISRRGGIVAITDLFALDRRVTSAPNVFRTLEETVAMLADCGWRVHEIGCGLPLVTARWADTAARVEDWIETHCVERPGYAAWLADRDHLRAHVERGDVLAGGLVATVT